MTASADTLFCSGKCNEIEHTLQCMGRFESVTARDVFGLSRPAQLPAENSYVLRCVCSPKLAFPSGRAITGPRGLAEVARENLKRQSAS